MSLTFNWSATQNIETNTSSINWNVVINCSGSAYTFYMYDLLVKINDVAVWNSATNVLVSNGSVVARGTTEIVHEDNGVQSLSGYILASMYNTDRCNNCSGSSSWALETIPRASEPSINNYPTSVASVNLGDTITVYTNKKSDFTHKVTARFGTKSYVIAESCIDSVTWNGFTVEGYAGQIPNSVSGDLTIIVDTKSGSNVIGTKSVTIPAYLPASVKPTLNVTLTNTNNTFGNYSQYISGVQVKPVASGIHSSTIKSIIISITGLPNRSAVSGTTYTFDPFITSGSKLVSVNVEDSRGRTASFSQSINVSAYAYPAAAISVSRGQMIDGSFSKDDIGDVAKVDVSGNVYAISGNTLTPLLQYRIAGATSWIDIDLNHDVSTRTINKSVTFNADSTKTYEVQLIITDKAGLSIRTNAVLSNGFVPLDFFKGGGGVSVGKTADRNGFDCAMIMSLLSNSDNGGGETNWCYNNSGTHVAVGKTYAASDGIHLSPASGYHGYLDGTWSGTLSDIRLKRDIDPIAKEIINAVGEVPFYQFKMSAENYDHNVLCVGILAQDLKEAFEKHGVVDKLLMLDTVIPNPKDGQEYYCVEYTHFLIVRLLYDELKITDFAERLTKLESKIP